jgi:hypothetical protein
MGLAWHAHQVLTTCQANQERDFSLSDSEAEHLQR